MLRPAEVGRSSSEINVLAMQSTHRAFVWVQNRAYTAASLQRGLEDALREALRNRTQLDPEWRYEPPRVAGQTLTLSGPEAGVYQLRWFDPQTGAWQEEVTAEVVEVAEGRLMAAVPPFTRDLALKLERGY